MEVTLRRLTELLLNITLAVVAVASVSMVSIRIYEKVKASGSDQLKSRRIEGWRSYAAVGNRIGPSNTTVTVVEFTDFQCPVCRAAWVDLQDIRKQYPDRVALVIRNFPLAMHPFAEDAAHAAECADSQGAFEPYYNLLFSRQSLIGSKGWSEFARRVGVSDIGAFEACLAHQGMQAVLERDRAAGKQLGVVGTPTLLINDLELPGYPGSAELKRTIRSALDAHGG